MNCESGFASLARDPTKEKYLQKGFTFRRESPEFPRSPDGSPSDLAPPSCLILKRKWRTGIKFRVWDPDPPDVTFYD